MTASQAGWWRPGPSGEQPPRGGHIGGEPVRMAIWTAQCPRCGRVRRGARHGSRTRFHADHRLYAAWALAIVVGVRRGELAGLEWDRVDLDRGVLLVHWQRTATSKGVVE